MRLVYLVLGTGFLGLAALGVVIPILPTTPFVLLAAACYLRSSTRLHDRLLASRTFGPTVRAWNEHRAIPPRAKVLAIVMVTALFAISVVFVVESDAARAGLAGLGVILVAWLARRPSGTRSAAGDDRAPGWSAARCLSSRKEGHHLPLDGGPGSAYGRTRDNPSEDG